MKIYCQGADNQTVYPITVMYKGNSYLILYYYTEDSDCVVHTDNKYVLCFQSVDDMKAFCQKHDLLLYDEIAEYDFDSPIDNPVDYSRVLNNWNFLNTIANTFGMYYEGDCKKYNSLYELLFRLNTPVEPIELTYQMSEKYYKHILRVFRKQDRFLNLFQLYSEEQ